MSNKKHDVYFDLGSSKIRAGAIDKDNHSNNFYCESNFFFDQLNIEEELQKIIYNLEKHTKKYVNEISLMVDNPKMISIGISISKKIDGLRFKKEDIQFLIQDSKQQIISNYNSMNIIHIIIKNYKIDETDYTSLPEDANCDLLSLDLIFICLPKRNIDYIQKLFSKFDVSVNQIFCSSYAKAFNYKNNFSTTNKISFIDIGLDKTSVTCFKNDMINFFQIIPIGSHHITKDLSKVLDIDLETAEKIKLDIVNNNINNYDHPLDLIKKIIHERLDEILKLSLNSIKFKDDFDELNNDKIIFMGDGSKIINLETNKQILSLKSYNIMGEDTKSICQGILGLSKGINKQEVVVVPKKQIKMGFFEKLFHFFR